MDRDTLRIYLDSYERARPWLEELGLRQRRRGHANFLAMAAAGVTLDLLAVIAGQLERWLPGSADPDMALNNLDRYVANSRSPLSTASLFERDPRALKILVQLFSTSQQFSDLVVRYPEYFEELRLSEGRSVHPQKLLAQLRAEVAALGDRQAVAIALRRFCQLHLLRIGCGDVLWGQSLELTTSQLSDLADSAVEVALEVARAHLEERHGEARTQGHERCGFAVIALGKLGGRELNYSSDIDLLFVYDDEGQTDGPHSLSNQEFFGRVVTELVKLLAEHTERGQAYRVDLRLRPEGARGPLARSLASTMGYYDVLGRTWERQALIKARCIAGERALGEAFLRQIEPWIYRTYLTFAEISEIKALKRRMEHKAQATNGESLDVKTGFGGIRDVEFSIQFLQLLNGGELPGVRSNNTLNALDRLERAGCLTDQERHVLEHNYRFLRKLEHRLQIMFGLQTHRLPDDDEALAKLSRRMAEGERSTVGLWDGRDQIAATFRHVYAQRTELNRKVLDHLLHEAFPEEPEDSVEPEVDLVFQPEPDVETIQRVIARYPFRDVPGAYEHLTMLAKESVPFLSSRRCRHFLASIAPGLLREVAETPDPDFTLLNLDKVSASLGAKAVLWELFSFNPATMRLFVQVCASSQFLVDILTRQPGMIDDLMDSLVLNQPREPDELRRELAELCRGAEDRVPILNSFKNKELLRIGVRDILGKDPIENTNRSLSDVAEVILAEIAAEEFRVLTSRLGTPTLGERAGARRPCACAILALGKLGGREMTYHSDLDVVFLYEADGMTAMEGRRRFEPTTNFHFFSEWAQRVIRRTSELSAHGRLYAIDVRLRPTGKSGSLSTPLAEFQRYYAEGAGQLWERQALTKARVVAILGSSEDREEELGAEIRRVVHEAAFAMPWSEKMADAIRDMRQRLEASRSARNIKRGLGGLVDVEFLVQMLQLKYGRERPALQCSNTLAALRALEAEKLLSVTEAEALERSYRFLRATEARLRMMHNVSTDDLPEEGDELEKLARQLGYTAGRAGSTEAPVRHAAAEQFLEDCASHGAQTRQLFNELLLRHGASSGL